jgi:hypothetical protein
LLNKSIDAWLAASTGDPVPLPVGINLGGDGWEGLLEVIKDAGKRVALDLSACTGSAALFNPGAADTGERYVVSLVLPGTATVLADSNPYYAFRFFTALESVTGKNVASISWFVFQSCLALTTANFPEAVDIGINAFAGCTGLSSVYFPKAATINIGAFAGCTSLSSVDLPAAQSVGTGAFSGCTALTSASLPLAMYINDSAFPGCTALTTVEIPEAWSIGNGVFSGTGSAPLTVTLGSMAPSLGIDIFSGVASKAVTVKIPSAGTGYGTLPPPDTTTVSWGNGLRGGGWYGFSFTGGTVNGGITLTPVTY